MYFANSIFLGHAPFLLICTSILSFYTDKDVLYDFLYDTLSKQIMRMGTIKTSAYNENRLFYNVKKPFAN